MDKALPKLTRGRVQRPVRNKHNNIYERSIPMLGLPAILSNPEKARNPNTATSLQEIATKVN